MATATMTSRAQEEVSPTMANGHGQMNGFANGHVEPHAESPTGTASSTRPASRPKYLHVAAVHSKLRTSCLSHDSAASPSFLGFRNLMVIVLSKLSS